MSRLQILKTTLPDRGDVCVHGEDGRVSCTITAMRPNALDEIKFERTGRRVWRESIGDSPPTAVFDDGDGKDDINRLEDSFWRSRNRTLLTGRK